MKGKTLAQLYAEHEGKVSDKWSLSISEYDRIFKGYRFKPIRMLEIGIQNGGSLEILAKYFQNGKKFIGCDINPECSILNYNDPRISVVVGDANSDDVQSIIKRYSAEFDIVIDDGSHLSRDIIKSFVRYFPALVDGGLFVAEDLHCSYWKEYEGGLFDPFSSISFFKRLADVVNYDYWGVERQQKEIFKGFIAKYEIELDNDILDQVHSVEFINSICIVRKCKKVNNLLGARFIAGTIEEVVPGHLNLSKNEKLVTPPQTRNYWSSRDLPPEEELPIRLRELSECAAQVGKLKLAVSDRDDQISSILSSISWRATYPLRMIKRFLYKNLIIPPEDNKPEQFNAKWYLENNPDVASSGMDPFEHYITYGKAEGRPLAPTPIVKRILPRVGVILGAYPIAMKRKGGFTQVFKEVLTIFKNEGLSGIKQRIVKIQDLANKPAGEDRNDYTEWIRRYDTMTDKARSKMRERFDAFKQKPLVSVIMPVYNSKLEWLVEAIESVRMQIYPNWELCIADDASTDKAIHPILERYSNEDSRIKVVFREHNGHISKTSNSALELVTGEWVALLDHDDLLSEHALFWMVESINQNPDVRLLYSDEDKIDRAGRRFDPYFKCDWNLDLFYSHNLITHLGVYHADVLHAIGGFREGLEGAQDYDLALRTIEHIEPKQIHHIPRVLYHWRMHAESTAQSAEAKPYAMLAGEKALNEHFMRQKINARAEFMGYGYRAHYALPEIPPMVSLIIPTRNSLKLVRQCIESIIEKTTYPHYEILLVDNGSDDPVVLQYFDRLQAKAQVRVVRDERSFNYSALNNSAVKLAKGEVVGLINNDLEVITPEWLSEMVSIALQPKVGAVGARLWYPDETLQHGGVILGIGGVAGHSHKNLPRNHYGYFSRATVSQSLSAVTAACLLIRKAIYKEVGGLNEVNLQIAFNDVDFCLRLQDAGYRNVWTPNAELYHHESASRGSEDTTEKRARFSKEVQYMKQHWGDRFLNDPAYSPNLTLDHEDFSLAWPPRIDCVNPPPSGRLEVPKRGQSG